VIETKKKIIAIIPARIGSKGVKFKNIRKVKNLTLIHRTINQLKKLKLINTIAISTDSKIIQKIAIKNGIWCKNLRPKSISGDKSHTFEAINHVLKQIDVKYDYICEVHPTYVFRKSSTILDCLKKIKQKKYDSLISVSRVNDTSHPDFIIKKKHNKYQFKKSSSLFSRHQLSKCYKTNGYFIATKFENFKKYKKMIDIRNRNYFYEINNHKELLDINTKFDLKFANYL
jgi:CMP-N-acetylneuraminic acid synthetase